MAVLGRGKTYSDKPGWALDPKTKLELKRRKETRELPEKFGGREIVTSENREEYMAKKLKLAKEEEPIYEEEAEEETKHPIAPVPDKKYIKGTPEHKKAKAKQKPINGMPTNRR